MTTDALSLDALANLPTRGPWAVHVLAAAIAQGASLPQDHWPSAPAPVRLLSAAVAVGGASWKMSTAGGEWRFCLAPTRVCAPLATSGTQAFVLAYGENGLGYAVTWTDPAHLEVHSFDDEDGSHSRQGELEEWTRSLITSWLLVRRGDSDVEPDDLQLDRRTCDRFVAMLQSAADLRADVQSALASKVGDLERQIAEQEAAGALSETTYDAWSAAVDQQESIGPAPWFHLLPFDDE